MKEVTIRHIRFGSGTVVSESEGYIKVKFDNEAVGEKTFVYPDAFSSYIAYDDKKLQEKALSDLNAARSAAEKEIANHIRSRETERKLTKIAEKVKLKKKKSHNKK
ncbi:MAG: hypothetical protein Q4C12_07705 [Clostridia bacterium]|nr:hypothetical protein [Clostridia bacterium]